MRWLISKDTQEMSQSRSTSTERRRDDRTNDKYEPAHDKTYKMACAPSEDSDQPGHAPSLIRVFAVRSVGS